MRKEWVEIAWPVYRLAFIRATERGASVEQALFEAVKAALSITL